MKIWNRMRRRLLLALCVATTAFAGSTRWGRSELVASVKHRPSRPASSPIAITHDDEFVWSVNPDNDSVSVFKVGDDANTKVAEIAVGKEPWCVAITPDDEKAYVTNMASGTVSVISTFSRRSSTPSRWAPNRSAARSRRTAAICTSPTSRRTPCR